MENEVNCMSESSDTVTVKYFKNFVLNDFLWPLNLNFPEDSARRLMESLLFVMMYVLSRDC